MMLYGLFTFENYQGIGACGTVTKNAMKERERVTRGGSEVLALITSNREMRREISCLHVVFIFSRRSLRPIDRIRVSTRAEYSDEIPLDVHFLSSYKCRGMRFFFIIYVTRYTFLNRNIFYLENLYNNLLGRVHVFFNMYYLYNSRKFFV